jgi:hypothetical protein
MTLYGVNNPSAPSGWPFIPSKETTSLDCISLPKCGKLFGL